jgi:glutamine amidotransferase
MAYHGAPFLLYDLLFKPEHGIVVQSLKSDMGAEPTNGDGFGVGWYYLGEEPALYRSVEPAWHDRNMKDMSKHIMAPTMFAHVRAASPSVGTVQQTNCHPFKYGKWLWMHNGALRGHDLIKRDLVLRVDPKYFNSIEGTTDSEIFFYLALTFGLEDDVPKAVAKAVGFITQVAKGRGVKYPVMMTVCVTDGSGRMWAFRYSSEGKSRTLFYSTDPPTARALYPDNQLYRQLDDSTRLIVSEPLNELKGLWNAVPESTALFVHGPTIEVTPFEPINHE